MKRYLRFALSIAIALLLFVLVLPKVADLSEVWAAIASLTLLESVSLVAVTLWNLFTYWLLMVVVVPGLSMVRAMLVTQTSTAISNVLPGGPAIGLGVSYSMYSSWGFRRPLIALALVVSGLGDLFAKLLMPAAALVVLTLQGRSDPALVSAAIFSSLLLVTVVALFVVSLRSESSAHKIGTWAERLVGKVARPALRKEIGGWGDSLVRFRAETTERLQEQWWKVLGAALLSHFSLFFVLLVSLRHVGVGGETVGWGEALAAFAFVRLLSAVPITPGGLGVIELGLTAALVVAGGEENLVVAAVLVFRALTFLVQIPIGAVTYLVWRRSNKGAARPPVPAPPERDPAPGLS